MCRWITFNMLVDAGEYDDWCKCRGSDCRNSLPRHLCKTCLNLRLHQHIGAFFMQLKHFPARRLVTRFRSSWDIVPVSESWPETSVLEEESAKELVLAWQGVLKNDEYQYPHRINETCNRFAWTCGSKCWERKTLMIYEGLHQLLPLQYWGLCPNVRTWSHTWPNACNVCHYEWPLRASTSK